MSAGTRPGIARTRTTPLTALALCLRFLIPFSSALAQTDPSGSWRTWETEHFRVHAQTRNGALAAKAALEAERAYWLLREELTPPRGVIDLTLFDNLDVSNGFTTVFPSSRIAIYLNPPAGDPILGPYDEWLRMVITHELTHAFHLDRTRGLWRVAQYILGRAPGTFPNSLQPSWVAEGLATYYETRMTTAGRLRAGLHDQLLAAAAAARRWPRPGDATYVSPQWPGGFRPYAWGSHFFQWEAAARGDSVVPRFVERTSKNLWPLLILPFPAVSQAMRGAGGVGVDSAWRALRADWTARSARGTPGTVIARGSRVEPRPRVSPDGRSLAYVEADGRSELRLVVRDIASGRMVATHRANADVAPWWRGDTLYVGQLDFTSAVNIRSALYRWLPGRSWERVTGSERLARPFTARGQLMAVDLSAASRTVVTLEGGNDTVPLPAGDAWGFLAGSPNGEWMAGARHRSGQWDVAAWPSERPQDAIAVTDDAALDDDVAWTPAADRLLFTSERSGVPQILAYSMNGGSLAQVTDEPTGARQPAPAPDGSLFYATILWDGWAVVRAPARELPLAASRARPLLERDTLSSTEMRVSGYQPWPSLAPHFWLPTWHDVGGAGRFAGAATFGADAIGRTSYFAHAAVAPRTRRVEGTFQLAHQRWKALGIQLGATQTWDSLLSRLVRLQNGDTLRVTFGDRERTANLGAFARWRRWRSLLSARLDGEFEEDRLVIDSSAQNLQLLRPRVRFAGAVTSLAGQYLSYPALAISPENGVAVGGLYRHRWELGGPGWWSEVRGGASGYLALPLPGFAHWVLALRGSAGIRRGPSADGYDLGGASGEPFEIAPGYATGPGRRAFPLRGYPAVSTGFTRAATTAVELRIPVLLVGKAIWRLPLGLDRVSLTGFAESGGGWREGEAANAFALSDAGGELVVDASIPQDLSLRARVGLGVPLKRGLGVTQGEARWYLAFGTSF